jgi:hypothetical protein
MLFLLKKQNDANLHPGNLQRELWGHFTSGQPQYPPQYENEIISVCLRREDGFMGNRVRHGDRATWVGSVEPSRHHCMCRPHSAPRLYLVDRSVLINGIVFSVRTENNAF